METLLQTPDDQRTPEWEAQFLTQLIEGKLRLVEDKAISGPDGFPYLLAETASGDEPAAKIIDWLTQKGIGLVINPQREPYPDLVLSYGMLWTLHKYGWTEIPSENFEKDFKTGEPTEDVLPLPVRKMIKQFFVDNGVLSLRFMLVSRVEGLELCFSLESLGNPPVKEHEGIAEAISWFLPTNVGVTLASEKDLTGFVAV